MLVCALFFIINTLKIKITCAIINSITRFRSGQDPPPTEVAPATRNSFTHYSGFITSKIVFHFCATIRGTGRRSVNCKVRNAHSLFSPVSVGTISESRQSGMGILSGQDAPPTIRYHGFIDIINFRRIVFIFLNPLCQSHVCKDAEARNPASEPEKMYFWRLNN